MSLMFRVHDNLMATDRVKSIAREGPGAYVGGLLRSKTETAFGNCGSKGRSILTYARPPMRELLPVPAQAVKARAPGQGDVAWMLTATGSCLLMKQGWSLFYARMVRTRSSSPTSCRASWRWRIRLLWIVVGSGLAFATACRPDRRIGTFFNVHARSATPTH